MVQVSKWNQIEHSHYKQERGSLSAFSHMDTSDLYLPTREREGGVYTVTLRVYRNN